MHLQTSKKKSSMNLQMNLCFPHKKGDNANGWP